MNPRTKLWLTAALNSRVYVDSMTLVGIGVDLVHVPRIASIVARGQANRFASRILSKYELAEWQTLCATPIPHRVRYLAVRWSVKESAYKAMYPVTRPSWKELSYHGLSAQGHKPYIQYHPFLAEDQAKIGRILVSVSHDGDYVYSTVYIEEPQQV